MKRGLSGKTRRGGPPLERQRIAFRVIQVTFVGVALTMFWFAWSAFSNSNQAASGPLEPVPPTFSDVTAFLIAGVLSAVAAALMGFRTVRGPRLPPL